MILDPPTGFHFAVVFELFPQSVQDMRFQEVSGLSVEVTTETFSEGGENRFDHKLPKSTEYSPLELKRGMIMGSELIHWCREATENFVFKPTNLTISLLNEVHAPISAWYVVHAYPTQWQISNLNASENSLVIETIRLNYNYFTTLKV